MNMNLSKFWETVKFRESYSLQSMESQLDMTANEQKAVEKERNEWIWDSFISSVWYFLYLSWKRWKCSRAEKASLSSFPFNFSQLVSSVTQSDPTLWPHGLQHARFPCPSPTPGACSNSCPSSRWCHPSNSSSVIPFSSCPQSFPASRSFLMSQFFTSGGRSVGASASASVLPMNIQDWSPLELTGLTSLWPKGHSRVFNNATVQKHQFLGAQLSSWSNSHIRTWLLEGP